MSRPELNFRNLPRGLTSAQVRAHEMAPPHLDDAQFNVYATLVGKYPPLLYQKRFGTTPRLDLATFGATIHAALKNLAVGYMLQVRQDGNLVHTGVWNWAQTPVDQGIGWTEHTPMHVASVSKFLTAVGLVKLLRSKAISYDETIIDYLPKYWSKGPFIDRITFRNLMTQRSGFTEGKAFFKIMKSQVAAGVPSGVRVFVYSDINFGLCRILIPIVNGDVAKEETFHPSPLGRLSPREIDEKRDQVWSAVTLHHYRRYMQAKVFGPAGVRGATLTTDPGRPNALAYKSPDSDEKGYDSGDCSAVAGAMGWRLSTKKLLNVISHIRRENTIITRQDAQDVLDNGFGIDPNGCFDTPAGKIYSKSGFFRSGDREGHCVVYFLPNAMEAAVFVNSATGEPPLFIIVRDAFMKSLSE